MIKIITLVEKTLAKEWKNPDQYLLQHETYILVEVQKTPTKEDRC